MARGLAAAGRAPAIVAVENVCGTLTSRDGRDFQVVCRTYVDAGYRWGALIVNADRFLPQSRPRLFVIGVRDDLAAPSRLTAPGPLEPFHPAALRRAVDRLPEALRARMVWWRLPEPEARPADLADDYRLPASGSAAYRLTGDGVAVPVVRHLAEWLFEPIVGAATRTRRAA